MRMGYLSFVIISAIVLFPLLALGDNNITHQKIFTVDSLLAPAHIRLKPETVLPALIWNPHHLASGDSIHASLISAGFDAQLTDNLSPYLDSLQNYSLFIMGGILQGDSFMEPLEYQPYRAAIDTFLEHGGSMFWEGIWSLTCAIEPINCNASIEDDTLLDQYTKVSRIGDSACQFSYIQGVRNTYFDNIDSLGYISSVTDPVMGWWRGGVSVPITAPQVTSPGKAAVCAYRNSHTMTTNFSWSKLHDRYTSTRVELIIDVMNWLSSATGVEDDIKPDIPKEFSLSQNYPNPFNAQTTISYTLPKFSNVSIDIYDITGRKIETLQGGYQEAGEHSIVWNAEDRASGMYFYRIKAGVFSKTEKCILLK